MRFTHTRLCFLSPSARQAVHCSILGSPSVPLPEPSKTFSNETKQLVIVLVAATFNGWSIVNVFHKCLQMLVLHIYAPLLCWDQFPRPHSKSLGSTHLSIFSHPVATNSEQQTLLPVILLLSEVLTMVPTLGMKLRKREMNNSVQLPPRNRVSCCNERPMAILRFQVSGLALVYPG